MMITGGIPALEVPGMASEKMRREQDRAPRQSRFSDQREATTRTRAAGAATPATRARTVPSARVLLWIAMMVPPA